MMQTADTWRMQPGQAFPEAALAMPSRWARSISKAPGEDLTSIRAHLLRLDREALYCRFGNVVTDDFLIQYVARAPDLETVIFGCWVNGKVRGIGELRRLGLGRDHEAEAAFTVERPFTDLGMGTALMTAVIGEAARIGVREIFSCFDLRNRRMRRIVQKFQGSLSLEGSDCISRIAIEPERAPRGRGQDAPPIKVGAS
jgi:hypothetical protein